MNIEHWIVGPEYDKALFERLALTLRALGYRLGSEWSGVGGSQEISHWEISGPSGSLILEAETYVGLSLSGSAELVVEVRQHFRGVSPDKTGG
ncbi:hypothetical protein KKC22_16990 [Myxococcota bacterium]|nr:hypothetical protein [Myxococcota bacterium]